MKKYFFIAVAAAAVLSGCAKEEEGEIFSDHTFTGVIESNADTKTTLDGTSVYWDSSDEIYINGVAYTTEPDTEDPTKATFTKKSNSLNKSATYKAFFADGTNSGSWNGTNYTLPASYTYSTSKFNMPMYAESTTNTLEFKNLCGVLKLSLTSKTVTSVSKIEISSDAQLNGAFTATSEGVLSFSSTTPTDAEKTVTVNFGTAQTLTETTDFYIPVARGSHTLSVKVYNGETTYSTLTMSNPFTFARGTIYSLSDSKLQSNGANPSTAI